MKITISLLIIATLSVRVQSQTGPGVPCICLDELTLATPGVGTSTSMTNAGDGSGRLFVTEHSGVIWIFDDNGTRLPEPFANLTESINGLLSLTFHPDYENNGRVYTFSTRLNETDGGIYNNVYECLVSPTNPNQLDLDTERYVFGIFCPTSICHNGGSLLFGPDNYLYIGHGDMDCCGDDANVSQNKSNHLGAISRIDVDARTGNLAYGIPPDNPFLSDPTAVPELYAYGFRQPYQTSMDRGDKITGEGYGRMFVGEIGADEWEEVDLLESGGNYGWAAYEGESCFNPELCGNIGPHIAPIAAYNHSHYGVSIISCGMYRGSLIPELNGWFIFSDYEASFFGMYEVTPGEWEWQVQPVCETCPAGLTNEYPIFITCMGTSDSGEQYFAGTRFPNGRYEGTRIYRITGPNGP